VKVVTRLNLNPHDVPSHAAREIYDDQSPKRALPPHIGESRMFTGIRSRKGPVTQREGRPMRIIHTISSYDVFGPEKTTINECLALSTMGWDCGIVNFWESADIPFTAKVRAASIPYQCFVSRSKFDRASIHSLWRVLRTTACEMVHSHGYKADLYSLFTARLAGVPVVTTIHGWTSENLKVRLYERLQAFLWRFFDRVICVSESYRKVAQALGVPSKKLVVVHNAIQAPSLPAISPLQARIATRNALGIPGSHIVVAIIGRLGVEKGHRYLLEAASRVLHVRRDVAFLIVGDGAERSALETEARRLQLAGNVIFAGHRNDMPSIYAAIDILAITSLREGLPNALLEAMLNAKPVVAMAVGGIPEVIRTREEGVLVPAGDVACFASELLRLIADRDARQDIGSNARARILDQFLFPRRMERIRSLYQELAVPTRNGLRPRQPDEDGALS
jgi:glycosyltransferase involved in cell wall biosynthesis